MSDWHGWGLQPDAGVSLHIGNLPDRKSIALYVNRGNRFYALAYFPTEEAATEAMEILDLLMHPWSEARNV